MIRMALVLRSWPIDGPDGRPGPRRDPGGPRQQSGPRRRRGAGVLGVLAVVVVLTGCNALAFGRNIDGRLGDGTTENRIEPVATSGSTTFRSIDAGEAHTCGIAREAGTMHCWGEADRNRLGLGAPFDDRTVPAQVGSDTDWVAVSAGGEHTCAVKANGTLWCWGDNRHRQSAPDTEISLTHAVRVDDRTDWTAVSAGTDHTCALRSSGNLFCWGRNDGGKLGAGDSKRGGIRAVAGAATWRSVDVSVHTCAIATPRARLFCWGANGSGQLGVGDTTFRATPTRVGTDENWSSVGTGDSHTCARKSSSSVWCWGANGTGQVGDGSGVLQLRPVELAGPDDWLSLAVGGSHSCGIRSGIGVWCWGAGTDGQLGNGSTAHRTTPAPIAGADTLEVAQVTAGGNHTQLITR
jgi:alpha-tubulin suppressor-like RCC1 family protein